ncbi:MAG: SDR family oxidoreductase [Acidobacteriota bacterium]
MNNISASETFHQRTILLIGATGFVGKVLLAMLLDRFPDLRRLIVLVRTKGSLSGHDRFYSEIVTSPPVRPVVEKFGLEALRQKITIIEGDLSEPMCGINARQLAEIGQGTDVIVNSAGLVDFAPPLNESLASNVYGVQHLIALAQQLHVALLHVSTCYVAGKKDGLIAENTPIAGYYPQRRDDGDKSFDVREEIAWCERLIESVRACAGDPEAAARYRSPSGQAQEASSRPGSRRWVETELAREGQRRAEQWGWINTYTYTKSMGEQLLAGTPELKFTIVRPAIIESAIRFPFPGWNEGLTTSAPLILMGGAGVKSWPVRPDGPLEIIPVDLIAAGILIATAAILNDQHKPVYQLATADTNPVLLPRLVAFLGMYSRRIHKHKKTGNKLANLWKTYVETSVVTVEKLRSRRARLRQGLLLYRRLLDAAGKTLGKRAVAPYQKSLRTTMRHVAIQEQTLDQFLPFMIHNSFIFETRNIREIYARLEEADRRRLRWDPETIDWADYWVNVHVKGIEKWVRPQFMKTEAAKEAGLE